MALWVAMARGGGWPGGGWVASAAGRIVGGLSWTAGPRSEERAAILRDTRGEDHSISCASFGHDDVHLEGPYAHR